MSPSTWETFTIARAEHFGMIPYPLNHMSYSSSLETIIVDFPRRQTLAFPPHIHLWNVNTPQTPVFPPCFRPRLCILDTRQRPRQGKISPSSATSLPL
jgi:hypothetical protein